MKNKIPRIIHQVWEGRTEPSMPTRLKILAETWKNNNPSWEYHLWNGEEMDELVETHFPEFLKQYRSFEYNVQRWDAIRYMILYREGGLYVDLDTECYKPVDDLFVNKSLCFGEETPEHNGYQHMGIERFWGNALMASSQYNEAWKEILLEIERSIQRKPEKHIVLDTTGPLMISRMSPRLENEYQAEVIDYKLVAPIAKYDLIKYVQNVGVEHFNNKIEHAYCAHYFFGSWEKSFSVYK